jgi:O-acetyl-ADP-ribose deacetylase (regulator of RNase III)
VLPGAVLPVPTTGLKTQGVKYVFHAAVVRGAVERGYEPITDAVEEAIRNSFDRFAELAATETLRSMLFPVFGVGTAGLAAETVAPALLSAIAHGMQTHPQVETAAVLVYVEAHRRALRAAATALDWPEQT